MMAEEGNRAEIEREMLLEAQQKGLGAKLLCYTKLSGPGWMQAAITLGGGSLASSLYLGVIGGFSLLWVQPLAMILGIIMLSAIGYVTLSTGERPFPAIVRHVNPVLGWGWALAVAAANIVWCLPQYGLANSVLGQNLLPKILGDNGSVTDWATSRFGESSYWATHFDELIVASLILLLATTVTWSYDRGGRGLRLYETMLKIVVGLIVISFFGVVIRMAVSSQGLDWSGILGGFIPDFSTFLRPVDTFGPLLDSIGAVGSPEREFWSSVIVDIQQDVMISAAATAVGINMTFLFAYSLLRKSWGKEHRGLVKFDLATGMLIPFLLATSCVVIASASQLHTQPGEEFKFEGDAVTVPKVFKKDYDMLMGKRKQAFESQQDSDEAGANSLSSNPSLAEAQLASTLVKRKSNHLAKSLVPLTGEKVANWVFGFGVLAMTLSTITILMLCSGFVITEMLGLPPGGWPHRFGTLLAGVGGALGPFIWGDLGFYLAIPTSVFGYVLLPFAYLTFFFLMNSKSLLGDNAPTGMQRFVWNVLMAISAGIATVGSVYMAHKKAGYGGVGAIGALLVLAVLVYFNRKNTQKYGSGLKGEEGSSS